FDGEKSDNIQFLRESTAAVWQPSHFTILLRQPRPLELQRKASQVEILSATMHMNWLLLLVSIVLISGEAAATDVLRKEEQSKLLHANTVVKTTRVLTSDEEARDINTGFSTDDEEKTNVKGLSKLADLDKATWKLRKMDMKLSNKL
ncbi:hypothetical protein L915_20156, partial [Phytophthora nicotianae]